MNDWEGCKKKTFRAIFKIFPHNLLRLTDEEQKEPQTGYMRFEVGTSDSKHSFSVVSVLGLEALDPWVPLLVSKYLWSFYRNV